MAVFRCQVSENKGYDAAKLFVLTPDTRNLKPET